MLRRQQDAPNAGQKHVLKKNIKKRLSARRFVCFRPGFRGQQAQLDSLWRAFHGDFYAFANTVMEADVQTDVVNKFGFVNPGPCLAEEERPEMGRDWPYDRANSGERHGSSHVLKLAKVPRRIVYKMGTQKCLTAVQPPSLWDAKRDMRKSGKRPPIGH